MIYEFGCFDHGRFEVQQSILEEHKANCPECGEEAQRIFPLLQWVLAGSAFRKDGSYREQNDYACLKG